MPHRDVTTKQEMFREMDRCLLEDRIPSVRLEELSGRPEFDREPFRMLLKLRDCGQSPVHHPEGSVWNHTLLVVNEAAGRKGESRNPRVLMWAALLHDIGKPATTRVKNSRITAYEHDTVGARLCRTFLYALTGDEAFINQVAALVRYHMHILYVVRGLPFAYLPGLYRETDVQEVALLGLCDRLGRKGARPADEEAQVQLFLARCAGKEKGGNQYGRREKKEVWRGAEERP